MNKKAQEGLPLTVIIAAIIVVVVLILVVTFFFGGFSSLTDKIKGLFFGGLAGTSETMAMQSCERYCDNLQLKSDPQAAASTSNYCIGHQVDLNNDGKITKDTKDEENVKCKEDLGVDCKVIVNGKETPINCGSTTK